MVEKMTIMERAKQFMPFAALHGFSDAIKEKETLPIKKAELSEEELNNLNATVLSLKKGNVVLLEYYSVDRYITIEGAITEIDFTLKYIRVIKTKILFNDLKSIKVIKC